MLDFINNVLDPIGIVIGIIVAIPVFWTWWVTVFGERRQRKELLKRSLVSVGNHPSILIIDILAKYDAEASVQLYVKDNENLKKIPKDRHYIIKKNSINREQLPMFFDDLEKMHKKIASVGCDEIHLFYAGPVSVGPMIGSILSNRQKVILYHYNSGNYENWGPMQY